jgi:hypothetical protein
MPRKNILTIVLIIIHIVFILSWIYLFIQSKKAVCPSSVSLPKAEEVADPLKAGQIGEPKEGEIPEVQLPGMIFNTIGTILEVKEDRIIIMGDGLNFSDQKPRVLTVLFAQETLTMNLGSQDKYQGLSGFNYLKPGTEIIVESLENIRGKTEFLAGYIHIL